MTTHVFKPGACQPKAGAPDFLKLLLSVCMLCVCLSAPRILITSVSMHVVCVCLPAPRLLITSGTMQHVMDLI